MMLHELTRNALAYVSWLAFLMAAVLAVLATRRESRKTLAFVATALLLTGMASFRLPGRGGADGFFNDQGEKFFPRFDDSLAATALEVVGYDPQTASATAFKVMQKDGRWVIPSHSDYPADAKDRLVKTATGVIDLTKDTIRSDRPEDHKIFGVLDPKDPKATAVEGLGKRVTLYNKSGEVLADFIIGKEVPGHPNQRYVRVPGKTRTYGVNVNVDLSTRFSDWIETNLLKLQPS